MTLGPPPSGAATQSIQLDIAGFKSHIEKTLLKSTGLLHLPAGLRFSFVVKSYHAIYAGI